MTNPFISITSNGGYIGRFYWTNTGLHPDWPHWGAWAWMPTSILGAWAGSIWIVRALINERHIH